MTAPPFEIRDWSDLPRAIVAADQVGAVGTAHLFRALRDGRIALLPINDQTGAGMFKRWAAATRGLPAIAVVGDDNYQDRGPAGFPVAQRVIEWASSVLLHAAGAQVEHYETAVVAAQVVHRVAVIECSTSTLPLWIDLVRRAPHKPAAMIITPSDGAHPAMPKKEVMQ
jgi:hypothetical protein